jgi:hypothetical protein
MMADTGVSAWRAAAAGATVLIAAAIGVITNLVTDQRSVTLAVALAALVAIGVLLQVVLSLDAPARWVGGTAAKVSQRARGSGQARIIQAGRDVILPPRSDDLGSRDRENPGP